MDFRTSSPKIGEFEKGTLKAIGFIERLSMSLAAVGLDMSLDQSVKHYRSQNFSEAEAKKLAGSWRAHWGLTYEDQMDWQDANKVYTSLRAFVESLGILVVHRQFKNKEASGLYIKVDGGPHSIVINTTGSSKARKLFTLAHEFAHVILREEGASNPSILNNRIERFCNHFAANLLAPDELVQGALVRFRYTARADDDFIRLFAKKLGLSQEATFLRLVELGLLPRSTYERWKAKFAASDFIPTGDMGDGGGGGGKPNPIRDKQTQYGSALLSLLGQARRAGKLDEIDVFRLCGLKPHYQTQLFGVA